MNSKLLKTAETCPNLKSQKSSPQELSVILWNALWNSGGGGINGGIAGGGNCGGTYVTSWNETANPTGFLSPSAVSAAAAVAIGLSPTHLAYTEQYCHMQVIFDYF